MTRQQELAKTVSQIKINNFKHLVEKIDQTPELEPVDTTTSSTPVPVLPVEVFTQAASLFREMDSERLQASVDEEAKRRGIIKEFVKNQLSRGSDYGSIAIGGSQSKDCLFKPGQEKIFSLFQITSSLEKDTETLEMLQTPGLIAYKCKLFRNGVFIGEGRGCCALSEKQNNANNTIKIAEKRARMDACLSLGFSEFFTQDLEDLAASPVNSAVARHEQREGVSSTPTPQGLHTVTVESVKVGVSASGKPWTKVTTDLGAFFNNTTTELDAGETYRVMILRNGITDVFSGHGEEESEEVETEGSVDDLNSLGF